MFLLVVLLAGGGCGVFGKREQRDSRELTECIAAAFDGYEGSFQHERIGLRALAYFRLLDFLERQRECNDMTAKCLVRLGEGEVEEFKRYFSEELECWKKYPYAPNVNPIILNIRDFGAVGDGKTDDTHAFAEAFDAVRALKGSPSVLKVSAGSYLVRGDFRVNGRHVFNLDASSLTNCVIEGKSPATTEIAFGRYDASGISLNGSKNTTLRNVHLYYKETPFSQLKVLSFDKKGRSAVVCHEPGTLRPTDPRFRRGAQRTQCCGQFDAGGRQLYGHANVFFDLQSEYLDDGTYRVHFADHPAYRHVDIPIGSILVLPDRNNEYQAIRTAGARLCNFENVWISNSRSGAFTVAGGWMMTCWKCKVFPHAPNLVLSTNADAFFNSRGSHLAHCSFSCMNDDGANSNAQGKMIKAVLGDGRTIVHEPSVRRRAPGDRVVVLRPSDGRYLGALEIESATTLQIDGVGYDVTTFKERIPGEVRSMDSIGMSGLSDSERQEFVRGFCGIKESPDQVYFPMAHGVGYVVLDNEFHDNRNIGIQIQCSNAIIASNRISRISRAMVMSCQTDWMEGPAPYNVLIRGNEVSEVIEGIRTSFRLVNGAVSCETPFRGIEIVDNVMTNLPLVRHTIQLKNASDVVVRGTILDDANCNGK